MFDLSGMTALVTGAVTAAVARLAALLPVPERFAGWTSLAAGTAAGGVTAAVLDGARLLPLLAIAVVVASVVAGLDRLLLGLAGRRSVPVALSAGAAPVLAVGTVAYAVARLVA